MREREGNEIVACSERAHLHTNHGYRARLCPASDCDLRCLRRLQASGGAGALVFELSSRTATAGLRLLSLS